MNTHVTAYSLTLWFRLPVNSMKNFYLLKNELMQNFTLEFNAFSS